MNVQKQDYSAENFMYDVNVAQDAYERGDIDRETYKGKVIAYANWFGIRKKLAKKVLSDRNFL